MLGQTFTSLSFKTGIPQLLAHYWENLKNSTDLTTISGEDQSPAKGGNTRFPGDLFSSDSGKHRFISTCWGNMVAHKNKDLGSTFSQRKICSELHLQDGYNLQTSSNVKGHEVTWL